MSRVTSLLEESGIPEHLDYLDQLSKEESGKAQLENVKNMVETVLAESSWLSGAKGFFMQQEWMTFDNVIRLVGYVFFCVMILVYMWHLLRYSKWLHKNSGLPKKKGYLIIQTFYTAALPIIALLSAGINGLAGIFWILSGCGFMLSGILWFDRKMRKGMPRPEKPPA